MLLSFPLCLHVASLSVEKHFDSNGNASATRPEVASESFSVGQCQAGTRLSHEEQSISGGGAGIVAIVARRLSLMKKLQTSAHKFISGLFGGPWRRGFVWQNATKMLNNQGACDLHNL